MYPSMHLSRPSFFSFVTHHLFTLTILSASGAPTVPPRRAENILLHCRSWISPHSMHLSHTSVYTEPIQSWWAERKQHIHTHSAHTQVTDEMKTTGFTWDTITFYSVYLKNNEVIMISMSIGTTILWEPFQVAITEQLKFIRNSSLERQITNKISLISQLSAIRWNGDKMEKMTPKKDFNWDRIIQ